ncbi:hypothetical protein BC828DRAFT_379797 [Blastocladiella britannica]|nr:hypothetical protein BC828DRAFT_379797 [Blastocladiella britannica]
MIEAAALGSLPVLDLLWQLAGPTTPARLAWLSSTNGSLISESIHHDHVHVLDWFAGAAAAAGIPVKWEEQRWGHCRPRVLLWAIEHKYVTQITASAALLSTTKGGDTSAIDWWIAQQPSKEMAMAELSTVEILGAVNSIKSLDWWWANARSQGFPDPESFANIINEVLLGGSVNLAEWWWSLFLEHRTPEHTFGSHMMTTKLYVCRDFGVVQWLWEHSHESGAKYEPDALLFFHPGWEYIPLHLVFSIHSPKDLPSLQWTMLKCADIGKQLTLGQHNVTDWIKFGEIAMLDFGLHSSEAPEVDWPGDIVASAIQFRQFSILEWWDRNQDLLPPQDMNCSSRLAKAATGDAVDIIKWWHARGLPASKGDWQQVCLHAIWGNAIRIQSWLLDHVQLFAPAEDQNDEFYAEVWEPQTADLAPFKLDFLAAIAPELDPSAPPPLQVYCCLTALRWYCLRYHRTIASLLPLQQSIWLLLFGQNNVILLEWWLKVYLATSRRIVLPAIEDMASMYSDDDASLWYDWFVDVALNRKISVFSHA